jgi:hypothetical protein
MRTASQTRRLFHAVLVGVLLAGSGYAAAPYATVTHFDDAWWIDINRPGSRPLHFHHRDYAVEAAACLNEFARATAMNDTAASERAVSRVKHLADIARRRAQTAKAAYVRAVRPFGAEMPDLDTPPSRASEIAKWERRRQQFFSRHPEAGRAKQNDDQAGHDAASFQDQIEQMGEQR